MVVPAISSALADFVDPQPGFMDRHKSDIARRGTPPIILLILSPVPCADRQVLLSDQTVSNPSWGLRFSHQAANEIVVPVKPLGASTQRC
jgi:hypothetical protein